MSAAAAQLAEWGSFYAVVGSAPDRDVVPVSQTPIAPFTTKTAPALD